MPQCASDKSVYTAVGLIRSLHPPSPPLGQHCQVVGRGSVRRQDTFFGAIHFILHGSEGRFLNSSSTDAPPNTFDGASLVHICTEECSSSARTRLQRASRCQCIRHVLADAPSSIHNHFKSVRTKALHVRMHVDDVPLPGSFQGETTSVQDPFRMM